MITPLVNIMHLLSSCICTYVRAIPNLLPLQFESFNFSSYLASTFETKTPLKSKMIKGNFIYDAIIVQISPEQKHYF